MNRTNKIVIIKIKYFIIILLAFSYYFSHGQSDTTYVKGLPNPAAVYCTILGYQNETRKDDKGNEYGVCIFPDGTYVDDFDFFRGEVGEKWSYGKRYGYHVTAKVVNRGTYNVTYANCEKYDTVTAEKIEIPQVELMKRNNEPFFKDQNNALLLIDADSSKTDDTSFVPIFEFKKQVITRFL